MKILLAYLTATNRFTRFLMIVFLKLGVGLIPKRGYLLTLEYYAFGPAFPLLLNIMRGRKKSDTIYTPLAQRR